MHTAPGNPTKEQIRERAYEIYLQRGGTDGSDITDWLLAEKELTLAAATSFTARELAPAAAKANSAKRA